MNLNLNVNLTIFHMINHFCANYEQNRFEADRVSSALMEFGSKDAKERHRERHKEREYEYLLDDEISFVKALRIEGKGREREGKGREVDAAEMAKKSIQEVRKSLPIYAYRESLLEAIRDNQVLVIEGELLLVLFYNLFRL